MKKFLKEINYLSPAWHFNGTFYLPFGLSQGKRGSGMRQGFLSFIILLFTGPASAESGRAELKLDRAYFGKTAFELSGITATPGGIYAVGDGPAEHVLYRFEFQKNRFHLAPRLNFKTLKGFKEYTQELGGNQTLAVADRRFDTEGVAACGSTFYVVNERVRQVLELKGGVLTALPIDFSKYPELAAGEGNAGLEGIAVDCAQQLMYLAKERDPRRLVTVAMKTWQVLAVNDLTPSERSGQKVINYKTGQGLQEISTDFADLAFDQGFLYVLERSAYEVAKVDPKTMTVVQRVSYYLTTRHMYDSDEPFAKAEALTLTKDRIVVGEDNNAEPLAQRAQVIYGVKGSHPGLYFFHRPQGF